MQPNRRPMMLGAMMLALAAAQAPAPCKNCHNVLMFAVDDLRPVGASFGESEALVPTLDKLASESVVFTNAWVQAATCGVSRSSLLTGRRPDTTEALNNGVCPFTVNPAHKDWVSLPQYFRQRGFVTAGLGKIFHPNTCEGAAVGEQAAAWELPYYHAPCISLGSIYNGSCYEDFPFKLPGGGKKIVGAYANASAQNDDDTPDGMIAKHAVATLHQLAQDKSKPFFLAVGFHKPHLPHIAPKKYFDMYPIDKVSLPTNEFAPHGLPAVAWNGCSEFLSYPDNAQAKRASGFSRSAPFDPMWTRYQRQAYFAASSFMDAQLTKVMNTMESLSLMDNTVIALWVCTAADRYCPASSNMFTVALTLLA
jgi:iduronate 2-sulfatase